MSYQRCDQDNDVYEKARGYVREYCWTMWAKLGLTFEIYPDRSYYAHVTVPQQ